MSLGKGRAGMASKAERTAKAKVWYREWLLAKAEACEVEDCYGWLGPGYRRRGLKC